MEKTDYLNKILASETDTNGFGIIVHSLFDGDRLVRIWRAGFLIPVYYCIVKCVIPACLC